MKFKELEVYGFKSFADKLQVKFGSGITAIVGPNGCGKSNVADSIRWVLGEQSAKLLRGKSMADVIFGGTEKRKSMSYCEVLLRFDNTPKSMPDGSMQRLFPSVDYNEVTISRKLYRSGESLYFVNGGASRLKEITDLLFDGGMGREGYSIIGQGRIEEILSAKPENRRGIFEEAAGIAKFKARKTEAERKLLRTRDNLTRIEDILSEKGRTLEPLTQEAEKARKYLDLRDKLKEHEINIYIYHRDNAEQQKNSISSVLDGLKEELEQKEQDFVNLAQEYRKLRDKYESSDAGIAALHEEQTRLNVNLEKQMGDVRTLRQRIEFCTGEATRLGDENQLLDIAASRAEAELKTATNEQASAATEIQKLRVEYSRKENEYLESVERLTEGVGKAEDERRTEIESIRKLGDIKANIFGLTTEKQLLNQKSLRHDEQKKEFLGRLKTAEQTLDECSKEVAELSKKRDETAAALQTSITKNNENRFTLKELDDRIYETGRMQSAANERHKILTDLKESFAAFSGGIQGLMRLAKDPVVGNKIEGIVAELIRVESKLETAVEVSLGGAYQHAIVRDENDANFLIDRLKAAGIGRVTFMPMSSAKPRSIDERFKPFLRKQGVLGIASELVKYDAKYSRVIQGYLGSTVIVENKEVAVSIAKITGYAFKLVTLEGEVFAPDGSITGGVLKPNRSVSNIFSHERELGDLDQRIAELKAHMASLLAQKTDLEAQLSAAAENMAKQSNSLRELELIVTAKTETLSQYVSDKEGAASSLEALEAEMDIDNHRLGIIENDLAAVARLEQLMAGEERKAGESGIEQSDAVEALRREVDQKKDAVLQLKIEIGRLESVIARSAADIERLNAQLEDLRIKSNANLVWKQQAVGKIAEAEAQISDIAERAEGEDAERIRAIKRRIEEIDSGKKIASARLTELENQREERSVELQSLRDKKTELTFKLESVDGEIELKAEKLQEDYGLGYEDCLPLKQENYDANKGAIDAAKLKRSIVNLGDVNVGAIERCKEAFEEYSKYSTDRDDLVKGETDLLKIIKSLATDMLKQFNENFEKIRTGFIKIFKELFDGGTADLILTEPEDGDPLSAGIDIIAQPPQKRLQSILLLSGGEKALTAIAILFAILRLRPMPFCVLDEIEAALDDANAARFAKYLRRFSEETQFIVITHRKPTMEQADSLYGVTMEEKGVSKMVSVKLSDAQEMAAEASGR